MTQVEIHVREILSDWQKEAIMQFARELFDREPRSLLEAFHAIVTHAVHLTLVSLTSQILDTEIKLVPVSPRLLDQSQVTWPAEVAALWSLACTGHREEFLERIGAVQRPGCPLWEINPLQIHHGERRHV